MIYFCLILLAFAVRHLTALCHIITIYICNHIRGSFQDWKRKKGLRNFSSSCHSAVGNLRFSTIQWRNEEKCHPEHVQNIRPSLMHVHVSNNCLFCKSTKDVCKMSCPEISSSVSLHPNFYFFFFFNPNSPPTNLKFPSPWKHRPGYLLPSSYATITMITKNEWHCYD